MQHFINDGYGWTCKACRETSDASPPDNTNPLPRFFREGEAEDRETTLSFPLLARWTDDTCRTLTCPRCNITEEIA